MSLTIGGGAVERFPSLVDAARAQREDNWREWEARKEASNRGVPKPKRRKPEPRLAISISERVRQMRRYGHGKRRIARLLGVSITTVERSLRLAREG